MSSKEPEKKQLVRELKDSDPEIIEEIAEVYVQIYAELNRLGYNHDDIVV